MTDATIAGPVITGPEQLTPAWVQQALRCAGIGVSVAATSSAPLGAGTGGGRHRLHLTYDHAPADAPATLVVKLAAFGPRARPPTAHRKEVGFYAEFAARVPVRAPRCHHAAIAGDGRTFTLLLEDVSGARSGPAGCDLARARGAMRELARLHAPFWNRPIDRPWLPVRTTAQAVDLAARLAPAAERFAERHAGQLAAGHAALLRAAAEVLPAWLIATGRPATLLHGDFRPGTLMFGPGGEVAVPDWQELDVGAPGRDLGHFLGTGLDVGPRRAHERELVGAYHAELLKQGVRNLDAGRCFEEYRTGLLQGLVAGVLGAQAASPDGPDEYLFRTMATRACTAVADHDTLGRLGRVPAPRTTRSTSP